MLEELDCAHRIITYAHCGSNICERPQAALREIDTLFFEILEFL
jgi:hypothetical protein